MTELKSILGHMKSSSFDRMNRKILERTARVAVIGLGYVGLPVARAFVEAGFWVTGYDKSPAVVDRIKSNKFLSHVTADVKDILTSEVFIVCVPTPLGKNSDPDLSHMLDVAYQLDVNGVIECLVVNESTVAPGHTEAIFKQRWLGFSPERINPGDGVNVAYIPKLFAGKDDESTKLTRALYTTAFHQAFQCASICEAEMAKLVENTYRAVNIALANEFKSICEHMGMDVWRVIDAAATKPFGFQAFYPGPGVGGHCIPIDPAYLLNECSKIKLYPAVITAAVYENGVEPFRLARKVLRRMGTGKTFLVVGIAYKKDVGDIRESPAHQLMSVLQANGGAVEWFDDLVLGEGPSGVSRVLRIDGDVCAKYDAVIVMTNHSHLDYEMLAEHPCVFDTRGCLPVKNNIHRV